MEKKEKSEQKKREEFLCGICHGVDSHMEKCPNSKLKDDSKENQMTYLLSVAEAMNKYKTSFKTDIFSSIENNFKKNDPSALERFTNNIPELTENLLILQPPKNFVALHLQLLNYWQKKLAYYEAIVNSQEDPLKAYIALDDLKNILQEGLDLSNVIIKQYQFLKS